MQVDHYDFFFQIFNCNSQKKFTEQNSPLFIGFTSRSKAQLRKLTAAAILKRSARRPSLCVHFYHTSQQDNYAYDVAMRTRARTPRLYLDWKNVWTILERTKSFEEGIVKYSIKIATNFSRQSISFYNPHYS